jgi:hypothetical protein
MLKAQKKTYLKRLGIAVLTAVVCTIITTLIYKAVTDQQIKPVQGNYDIALQSKDASIVYGLGTGSFEVYSASCSIQTLFTVAYTEDQQKVIDTLNADETIRPLGNHCDKYYASKPKVYKFSGKVTKFSFNFFSLQGQDVRITPLEGSKLNVYHIATADDTLVAKIGLGAIATLVYAMVVHYIGDNVEDD